MGKKGYIAVEGEFFHNWKFDSNKVFTTKKALHKYMEKERGHGFSRNRDETFHEKWQNKRQEYGYIIEEVLIICE